MGRVSVFTIVLSENAILTLQDTARLLFVMFFFILLHCTILVTCCWAHRQNYTTLKPVLGLRERSWTSNNNLDLHVALGRTDSEAL